MDWHYAIGNEQLGPVSENELALMVSSGRINANTLVWRDPMKEWLPLKDAPGAPRAANAGPPPLAPAPQSPAKPQEPPHIPALNKPSIKMPLPLEPISEEYGFRHCGKSHYVRLYPAILRKSAGTKAKELLEADEASCFYHAQFAATNVCSHSGRFICDLCSTEWEGETISLQALDEIKSKGKSDKLNDKRTLWDDIALALVIFPILFYPLMIFTAPIAVFICLWKWRQGPTSLVRRTRIRYVIALVLGLLEVVLIGLFFFGLLSAFNDF